MLARLGLILHTSIPRQLNLALARKVMETFLAFSTDVRCITVAFPSRFEYSCFRLLLAYIVPILFFDMTS